MRTHFPRTDAEFELTRVPAEADFIIVSDLRPDDRHRALRHNELLRRFPEKCFVVYDGDDVPRFCQGVLTSLTASRANLGRFRSGGYFLFHPDFKNPYVERWFAERKRRSKPPPAKEYLACFSGRDCIPLRRRVLDLKWRRDDIFIRDTSASFDNFTHQPMGKDPAREGYFNIALSSKFMLCPRGVGAASIRFFEAMQLGIVPVLISDAWVLPEGPDWSQCMLRIPENALDTLEDTLVRHEGRAAEMGAAAQRAYADHFHGEAYVRSLLRSVRAIQRTHTAIPERWCQRAWGVESLARKLTGGARRLFARPSPPLVQNPA